MCEASISISYFNRLMCAIGIRAKLLDFRADSGSDMGPTLSHSPTAALKKFRPNIKAIKYLKYLPIILFVAFVFSYSRVMFQILDNVPTIKGKKTIDYFISHVYFSTKFVVIIIYAFQYWNERPMCALNDNTMAIFHKIKQIDRYWRSRCQQTHSENIFFAKFATTKARRNFVSGSQYHLAPIRMEILTKTTYMKIVLSVIGFTVAHHIIAYSLLTKNIPFSTYDFFWFIFPTIFVVLFVWQLSIGALQLVKLFEFLNQTLQSIAVDIRKRLPGMIEAPATAHKPHRNRVIDFAVGRRITINATQSHTASKHIQTLFNQHDRLRANTQQLQQLHSIQLTAVILYALINLVAEVSV